MPDAALLDDPGASLTHTPLDVGTAQADPPGASSTLVGPPATNPGGQSTNLGGFASIVGGFFSGPDVTTPPGELYTPPAGTTRVGADTAGNPLFQLTDAAGNIIKYAVGLDTGTLVPGSLQNLGPSGTGSFSPLAGWQSTGKSDSSGNPLYTVTDAAGRVLQFFFNPRTNETGALTDITPAQTVSGNLTGGSSAGGGGGSSGGSLFGGGGLGGNSNSGSGGLSNLLSNVLTGNNSNTGLNAGSASGGLNIAPVTVSPTTTKTNVAVDNTNNSKSTTNTQYTVNQNDASLFNNIVDKVTSLFGSVQSAKSAVPLNDAALGAPIYPNTMAVGQTPNSPWSMPVTPAPQVATVSGSSNVVQTAAANRWLIVGVLVAIASLVYLIFFRKK